MGNVCICRHARAVHTTGTPSVCSIFDCKCLAFVAENPSFPPPPSSEPASRFSAIAEELDEDESAATARVGSSSRFTMVAAELAGDDAVARAEMLTSLHLRTDDDDRLVCRLCNTGAFTPGVVGVERVKSITCRGCMTLQVYRQPDGKRIATNDFRCERCGTWTDVSLDISVCNLRCDRCRQLTVHVRRPEPAKAPSFRDYPEPLRAGESPIDRSVLTFDEASRLFDGLKDTVIAAGIPIVTSAEVAEGTFKIVGKRKTKGFADLKFDELERDAARLWVLKRRDELIDMLVRRLELVPFDEWAQRRRNENIIRTERGEIYAKPGEAYLRGTGRTTRGLVESIAVCIAVRAEILYVRGTWQAENDAFDKAQKMCAKLRASWPPSMQRLLYPERILHYIDNKNRTPGEVFEDHTVAEAREKSLRGTVLR